MLGSDGGAIQRAIDRCYCEDAAFSHPLARIKSGPQSREALKDVWAVYKVSRSSRHAKVGMNNCTITGGMLGYSVYPQRPLLG